MADPALTEGRDGLRGGLRRVRRSPARQLPTGLFRIAICLLTLSVLLLDGCESIAVTLGLRTRLDKVPITSLSASLSPQPRLGPGQSGKLIIVATTADGQKFVTTGPGHGKVLFDSFTIAARIATVDKKGVVSLSSDARLSDGKMPHVRITAMGHPGIEANLDIPVRYDLGFAGDFSGPPGSRGSDGMNGMSGSSGSTGSMDPNNPSAGGNGGDGTNGTDGDNGGNGGPGQDVHVWVTLKTGPPALLQVRAASASQEQFFLVDPNGGSLEIRADGGPGGAGGSGGRGGQGGSGGMGIPSGSPGSDGLNGQDGFPGGNGPAGTIVVSIDPTAKPFLDKLSLSNTGGNGKAGPPPEIRVEPVSAIW